MMEPPQGSTSVETLCDGLPPEFAQFITYCRELGFDEQPDYAMLRRRFRDAFKRYRYADDNIFDWTTEAAEQHL
jgi:hypothetical protein